jgi:hypothetical protein
MQPDAAVKRLQDEFQKLDQSITEEREIDRRATIITISLAAAIGLVIVGFLLVNFIYFKSEWTEEKFAKSLQTELEVLNPVVLEQLRTMGKNLMPVYAEEARRQLPGMAPRFSKELSRQLEQFSYDFQADTVARFDKTEERIRAQTHEIVFAAYPGLRSEAEQEKLNRSFETITHDAVAGAIEHFQTRFSKDTDEMQSVILDFKPQPTEEDTVDLQKKFIHLWLQLLDEEIMRL